MTPKANRWDFIPSSEDQTKAKTAIDQSQETTSMASIKQKALANLIEHANKKTIA